MTSKKIENSQWTDPKDFGLPHVEIKPLPSLIVNSEEAVDLKPKDEEILPISKETQIDQTQEILIELDSNESKFTGDEVIELIQVVDLEQKEEKEIDSDELELDQIEEVQEISSVLETSNIEFIDSVGVDSKPSVDLDPKEESFTQDLKQAPSEEMPVLDDELNSIQQESISSESLDPNQAEKELVNPVVGMVSDQKTIAPKTKEPAKSKAWIWIAAILALVLIAVIFYQIQEGTQGNDQENLAQNPTEIQSEQADDQVSNVLDSIPVSSQDISTAPSSSDSISGKAKLEVSANTATIRPGTSENGIIKISTKLEKPRYFIVVGSLPSENLAIQQAEVYKDRAQVIYLILPYGNIPNHRLAVGYFDSLNDASNEVERIKNQYKEQLWILKY